MFGQKLYAVERRELSTVNLPAAGKTFFVYQGGFGYSQRDSTQDGRKRHRATKGRANLVTSSTSCHLLCLTDRKRKVDVLAHIDPALDPILPVYRAISYLVGKGVIAGPSFDDVSILTSFMSSSVRRTYLTMQLLGMTPNVRRCIPFLQFTGFMNDGQFVVFSKPSLSAQPELSRKIRRNHEIRKGALEKRTFFCSNDDEYHSGRGYFDVLPGVPAFDIQSDADGTLVRIMFNVVLPTNFTVPKLPRMPGTTVDIVDSGAYVHIDVPRSDNPLAPSPIRFVQGILYTIAEQIVKCRRD